MGPGLSLATRRASSAYSPQCRLDFILEPKISVPVGLEAKMFGSRLGCGLKRLVSDSLSVSVLQICSRLTSLVKVWRQCR